MATEFLAVPDIKRYSFTQYPAAARTVTDGVTTNASTSVTSATAAFTALDVGATIAGTGIPGGTTIASVTNATTVVTSAASTATGSSLSLTITRTNPNAIAAFQTAYQADISVLATTQALYTTAVPTVAVVITPSSGPVLSVNPTDWLGYNYGNWQVVPVGSMGRTVTDGATTSASTTITSATAAFAAGDVGANISGSGIPISTTIASVTNGTTVVVSRAATATASSVAMTITRTTALYTPDVI